MSIGGRAENRRARQATAEERSRLWPELVRRNPGYVRYEKSTRRRLPIVILEPLSEVSPS